MLYLEICDSKTTNKKSTTKLSCNKQDQVMKVYSIQENKDIQVMMNNTRREKRDSR
jgi:hypothetical protein